MKKQRVDDIIKEVAQMNHTTPENVRRQMEDAIEQAQESTDPIAQAHWASMPRKGEQPTLEEFIAYVLAILDSRL
ncbi:MAG: hypothetical protein IKB09_06310 [Oscillospiraceae bacterium]|nr:hypothetical protein [Oscillospiraceae bacterium]